MIYADMHREQAINFLVIQHVDTRARLAAKDTETLLRWVKFWKENAIENRKAA